MEFEAVIGLEVHAELSTKSKMFCSCPVVDSTQAEPNVAVCPVCGGMPGVLPVINEQAVAYGIKVALALECQVANTSIFARKNYFYPDLPKGYQISQYEYPLAEHGRLRIQTSQSERDIRIRRVHLEEDTGKLTHVDPRPGEVAAQGNQADPADIGNVAGSGAKSEGYSLVDLNRAGVPLLEIVSEPDMHTLEEVRAYSEGLRAILRYLGVNSGDMEKGVIRFEANVSVRPAGSQVLGTRVEIKNLNSFRALERATAYQIEQQIAQIQAGKAIAQETLGWDDARAVTYSQRSKEEAHDYRYFPEPDLPPLVVEQDWIERIAATLPELPFARARRFMQQYELSLADANLLASDRLVADYFEATATFACADNRGDGAVPPRMVANWITGEIFSWLNLSGHTIQEVRVPPAGLAELLRLAKRDINLNTAKNVLSEMLETGKTAPQIIQERGLKQISDAGFIAGLVQTVLQDHPQELASYLAGKETLSNWFYGQVMRAAKGQANPPVLRSELERQLAERKK
ncbi:MAG: Asp-tRNA(Asn)/Glu-tRNA(Gln) amidotransferase subunit GatB [Chloroflexi bacterium]|nr:MAG: Asp-tRNA(Asn)/Glu-tRNA(Gln) amidotransferase subunit GatB [Chloroflexota bacterium]